MFVESLARPEVAQDPGRLVPEEPQVDGAPASVAAAAPPAEPAG